MSAEWGGWWTEAKLDILDKYLAGFGRASKKAGRTVYLDLFAGKVDNVRPDTGTHYPGSTVRAMRAMPRIDRLVFWERDRPAEELRRDLETVFPKDERYCVIPGDCNATLQRGLGEVADMRWAPTFAFLDPKGLDVKWTTLEQLSRWRRDSQGRKVELWILFPEPALARVLGLRGVRGQSSAEQLSSVFGTDAWIAIQQRRWSNEYSAEETRGQFVNLYRWLIQKELGYKMTHALQLGNVSDQPMYTMVFATDVKAGSDIMRDVYHHAKVHEIPALRAHAVSVRSKVRESAKGVERLFEVGDAPLPPGSYVHREPWEPPEPRDEPVELDAEPPDEEEDER